MLSIARPSTPPPSIARPQWLAFNSRVVKWMVIDQMVKWVVIFWMGKWVVIGRAKRIQASPSESK